MVSNNQEVIKMASKYSYQDLLKMKNINKKQVERLYLDSKNREDFLKDVEQTQTQNPELDNASDSFYSISNHKKLNGRSNNNTS